MTQREIKKPAEILPEMTVLDVVAKYRQTEAVFKKYDEQAGECICCQALFETVEDVAEKYDLDLASLLEALNAAAGTGEK